MGYRLDEVDLWATYTKHSELRVITALFLMYTLYSSPLHTHTHYCPQSVTLSTSRFLVTDFNTGTITVSLNYTLQISWYHSTHKVSSSQPDFQLH
jgi:hypothetical protein